MTKKTHEVSELEQRRDRSLKPTECSLKTYFHVLVSTSFPPKEKSMSFNPFSGQTQTIEASTTR